MTTTGELLLRSDLSGARVLAQCLAVVLVLLVWSRGLQGPYQFDDQITPLSDPASQSLLDWATHLTVTLRPLTKLTYALEAEAGLTTPPAPRRLVSLLILIASAWLLYRLLITLQPADSPIFAALLALLWCLHPVHADSVLLVSGRSALLAGFCLLASLLALAQGRPRWSALLFLLACLARETALAGLLPLVVLAAASPGAQARTIARQLLPILSAAVFVIAWLLITPRYVELADYSWWGRPFWASLYAQVGAVPLGLLLLVQPAHLSIDYGLPLPTRAGDPWFIAGLACYALAIAGIVVCLRRSRTLAMGLALWLAALLPTQSVIPKLDALSNRPLALALAGLLFVVAALLPVLRKQPPHGWLKPGVVALCLLPVGALAWSAAQRAALFDSSLTLWADAAAKSSAGARPHLQHALLLKQAGRDGEAWRALARARHIDPFHPRIAHLHTAWRPEENPP